ncbi:MAG: hypothetical protein ACHP65_01700 [Legionellales bacterium]
MPDFNWEDVLSNQLVTLQDSSVKLKATHDQEKTVLQIILIKMQAEEKDDEASELLIRINEIEKHMLAMEDCCNDLIAETKRLILVDQCTTKEQIKSWSATVTKVIELLDDPNNLYKIKSLKKHAALRCEALSQSDTCLQTDRERRRYGLIANLVAAALLVVFVAALIVVLIVATLGFGATVALIVAATVVGLGCGGVGLFGALLGDTAAVEEPKNARVAENLKPERKISNSAKDLAVQASTLFAFKAATSDPRNVSPDEPKNEKTPGQDLKNN